MKTNNIKSVSQTVNSYNRLLKHGIIKKDVFDSRIAKLAQPSASQGSPCQKLMAMKPTNQNQQPTAQKHQPMAQMHQSMARSIPQPMTQTHQHNGTPGATMR